MAADESERPTWKHRNGDRYVAVFGDWWGNPEQGYHHEWSLLGGYDTHAGAKRTGLREQGSDDFNIAVVRDHKVVATLWMDEVVDDDPVELAPLQAVLSGR